MDVSRINKLLQKYGEKVSLIRTLSSDQQASGDKPWKPTKTVASVSKTYTGLYAVYWTKETKFMELVAYMRNTDIPEGQTYILMSGSIEVVPKLGDVIVSPLLGKFEYLSNDPIILAGKILLHVMRCGQ